jgi:hypothetical protein
MSVSECVALRLVSPGVVVTWFVTGFLDPGKVDGPHPALLEACPLRRDKLTMAGRRRLATWQARFHLRFPAVVP